MSTAWSTDLLCTCRLPMTKECNWLIINMSVMLFCHWLAACTYQVYAPSTRCKVAEDRHSNVWIIVHVVFVVTLKLNSPMLRKSNFATQFCLWRFNILMLRMTVANTTKFYSQNKRIQICEQFHIFPFILALFTQWQWPESLRIKLPIGE